MTIRRRFSGSLALLALGRLVLAGAPPCASGSLAAMDMRDVMVTAAALTAPHPSHDRDEAPCCQPTGCVVTSTCATALVTAGWTIQQPRAAAVDVPTMTPERPPHIAAAPEPPPPRA